VQNVSCFQIALQFGKNPTVFGLLVESNAAPYLKTAPVILSFDYLKEDASVTIQESCDICKRRRVHEISLPSVLPLFLEYKAKQTLLPVQFPRKRLHRYEPILFFKAFRLSNAN